MTDTADLPQDLIDRVRALSPARKAALRALFPVLSGTEIEEADPVEIVDQSADE